MPETLTPDGLMKVTADIGQVLGILRASDVTGPMRDYAEKRVAGDLVDLNLSRAAFNQAKKLVEEAKAQGKHDTSLNGVSVGILEGLMTDLNMYAKMAMSRQNIQKLANKFELALSKK